LLDGLLTIAVVFFVFLILPLGFSSHILFGLIGDERSSIPFSIRFLLAWVWGWIFLILFNIFAVRVLTPSSQLIDIQAILAIGSTVFFWLRCSKIIRLGLIRLAKRLAVATSISIPLFLILNADSVRFFPIIDLFQRVHFHFGALLFAEYFDLDPFVADSYVPFQQILLGTVRHLGVDSLLVAEWVIAPIFAGLFVIVARDLFKSIGLDGEWAQFGAFTLIVYAGIVNPTNGDMSLIVAFGLLAFLFRHTSELSLVFYPLTGLMFGGLIWICFFWLPVPIALAGVLILVLALVSLAGRLISPSTVTICLLVGACLFMHRAGVLFAILAFSLHIVFTVVSRLGSRTNWFLTICGWNYLLGFSLIVLLTYVLRHPDLFDGLIFGGWFRDTLFAVVLKKEIVDVLNDPNVSLGTGMSTAVFEFVRKIPLAACLVIVAFGFSQMRRLVVGIWGQHQISNNVIGHGDLTYVALLAPTLLATSLIFFGLPFVHRATAMVGFFLIAITLHIAKNFLSRSKASFCANDIKFLAVIYLASFSLGLYLTQWEKGFSEFFYRDLPVLSLIFLICVFIGSVSKKKISCAIFVMMIMVLERAIVQSAFASYRFGESSPPSYSHPLSSFDSEMLNALNSKSFDSAFNGSGIGDAIVVSDYKTMSFVMSQKGWIPLVPFTNLATASETSAENFYRDALRSYLQSNDLVEFCNALRSLGARPSINYRLARTRPPLVTGSSALNRLGYNNRVLPNRISEGSREFAVNALGAGKKMSLLVVLSTDTYEWLYGSHYGYFGSELDPSVLSDLVAGKGFFEGERFFVKRLLCQ